MMSKRALLIGGSHDGEMREVHDFERELQLVAFGDIPLAEAWHVGDIPTLEPTYKIERYIERHFECGDRGPPIRVWHIDSMTTRQVLELLLSSYAERVAKT